jgi:transcriptional regulator with XRE-family HTH domain
MGMVDPSKSPGIRASMVREAIGLTRAQLAEAAGVEKRSLDNWEIGRTKVPVDVLSKLAKALGTTVDELCKPLAEADAPKRKRGRPFGDPK